MSLLASKALMPRGQGGTTSMGFGISYDQPLDHYGSHGSMMEV